LQVSRSDMFPLSVMNSSSQYSFTVSKEGIHLKA
jgi:hypothetical protein